MGVMSDQGLPDVGRGSLVTMVGNAPLYLLPSNDGSVLTCSANATDGSGLLWTKSLNLSNYTFQANVVEASQVLLTTGLGVFNASPPGTQPTAGGVTTGTTAGTTTALHADSTITGGTGSTAYTVGDLVAALKAYGLIAP